MILLYMTLENTLAQANSLTCCMEQEAKDIGL